MRRSRSATIDPPVRRHPAVPVTAAASEPVIAWRTWLVARDRHGPVLHSVAGQRWDGPVAEARCLAERHHPVVPDPRCACGIYGRTDDLSSHAPTLMPRARPIVAGFVELSGRVVRAGDVSRASAARIVGPLLFSPIRPTRRVALARRFGRSVPLGIVAAGDRYAAALAGPGRRVTPLATWKAEASARLRARYGVPVEA